MTSARSPKTRAPSNGGHGRRGRGKVSEARKRLAAALEQGKEIYGRVREKAVEGVKATDEAVHEHPYPAIGIALGVGALVGYLVARRCSRNGD
jgi:ElaB/YqjD/DUF883 family membrane-anchored ribosome-binding protein